MFNILLGPCDASIFENFRIGRACPLLVVVKRLKALTALSGTVYRLASSMSDHTPVLFNVFEDWIEESVVPHISFVSFVICRPALLQCTNGIGGIEIETVGPSWNVLSGIYGRFDSRFDSNSNRNARFDSYSIRTQTTDSQRSVYPCFI